MASNDDTGTEHILAPENELRFEVSGDGHVEMRLVDGLAELFGTELTKGKVYSFVAGSAAAIFTWHGCKIHLKGKTEVDYIARETPMRMYINSHAALEQMRVSSEQNSSRGPRIMVVGPTDVGKSTLCKLLVNYATRVGRQPILVDLDVGQNQLSLPGTLAALIVERPADVVEGFALKAPLVYHYGHKTPTENLQLYLLLISRLAEVTNTRCEANSRAKTSGIIINTCGYVRGAGYTALKHAASAFEVDVICVLDQERLQTQLSRDIPDFVKIVLLPKSGGVIERSSRCRMDARDQKIREYFYGVDKSLYPHTFEVKFSEVEIFRIGAPQLPDSMLPLGQTSEDQRTKLVSIEPSGSLAHSVLSVSAAAASSDPVVEVNVVGFIVVTAVDMERQRFTVLAPTPRPLPRNILLVMDEIQFLDFK